ncbi:MAG TPA: chromosomal replication initiator protein DnaA [Candidatus Woesebacteria bacterium]|nr:chromosomal replication initiator protein DnaA [Candidatus Woesebacteria bacterium]HNS94745.1 chromosomal replication initiator protein DnaA [Candidatus Woesebacteria bacterium]
MSDVAVSWQNFVSSYIDKAPKNDVWSQTLKQLELEGVDGGVAHFTCPSVGVKTIALNKQAEVVSIASAVLRVPIFSILCEVKKAPRDRRDKQTNEPLPIMSYQPSLDDLLAQMGLNPKHTFENFAVSNCNNVAFAAAQAVASQVGKTYNPLFVWGGVGVGKTHLVQATARRIAQINPHARIAFCPGDRFTNEIIEAIQTRSTHKFRLKYRKLDVLIIDDIQFISGKNAVQEEFFHTFNDIISRAGQVMLVSDRPPQDIPDIEDRLRSRFSGGLTIDISPPDFELKTAIALIKGKERGIDVDIEAAKQIALISQDNRAVEGTLLACYAKLIATNTEATPPKLGASDIERYVLNSKDRQITRSSIDSTNVVDMVCSYYKIKPLHLKQPNRIEHVARARHVLMYVLREKLKLNYEAIARITKRRDHTTVIHGVRRIKQELAHNQQLKSQIVEICQNLSLPTD